MQTFAIRISHDVAQAYRDAMAMTFKDFQVHFRQHIYKPKVNYSIKVNIPFIHVTSFTKKQHLKSLKWILELTSIE